MTVRRARARVNVAAIARNCERLRRALAPGCELMAVVKADGYGHGAIDCARAALDGGARLLAVNTAGEAVALRDAGIEGRLLVLGPLSEDELEPALRAGAEAVAWREAFAERLARAARRLELEAPVGVHVKLDTGMGRLGTRDEREATAVADAVHGRDGLALAGAMTHFATADDDPAFMAEQMERFEPWAKAIKRRAPTVPAHAANSAATLRSPETHCDIARCGMAIYGLDPFQFDPAEQELEPALELSTYVAEIKRCMPGESVGYGRRWVAERPSWIATLPLGYGDGVRRGLSDNADVLIGGRRRPLVGTVSMDAITVLLAEGEQHADGPPDVELDAPAVLLGAQGEERILAEEMARRLGTINYEVTCAITARVPREPHRDGEKA